MIKAWGFDVKSSYFFVDKNGVTGWAPSTIFIYNENYYAAKNIPINDTHALLTTHKARMDTLKVQAALKSDSATMNQRNTNTVNPPPSAGSKTSVSSYPLAAYPVSTQKTTYNQSKNNFDIQHIGHCDSIQLRQLEDSFSRGVLQSKNTLLEMVSKEQNVENKKCIIATLQDDLILKALFVNEKNIFLKEWIVNKITDIQIIRELFTEFDDILLHGPNFKSLLSQTNDPDILFDIVVGKLHHLNEVNSKSGLKYTDFTLNMEGRILALNKLSFENFTSSDIKTVVKYIEIFDVLGNSANNALAQMLKLKIMESHPIISRNYPHLRITFTTYSNSEEYQAKEYADYYGKGTFFYQDFSIQVNNGDQYVYAEKYYAERGLKEEEFKKSPLGFISSKNNYAVINHDNLINAVLASIDREGLLLLQKDPLLAFLHKNVSYTLNK